MERRDASYRQLISQLESLIEGEANFVANMANASALLLQGLENINWVGFYLCDAERRQLVLGPFQGLPACVRIPYGKGICGAAIEQNCTQVIHDLHQGGGGPGSVGKSRSELVVPLRQGRTIVGVLDINSPVAHRFDKTDQDYLELFSARLIAQHSLY